VDLLARKDGAAIPRELAAAAGDQFGLSPREREVAALLTQGLQYNEIADRLFISIKTVKTHAHRLYEKTETRNRMELANRLRA
jgi:DNA-binding CsgD family transcriptional regulator